MKIAFIGPSLPDAGAIAAPEIELRAPAVQGDILAAIIAGATVIGLVDGGFEYTAPVWHKEILFALSKGVVVIGGASMGALRAAECHSFGMIGVGRIFEQYASGMLIDDADVALSHAPRELRYQALTLPMVNVRATLSRLSEEQLLSEPDRQDMEAAASGLFFKERTWAKICSRCPNLDDEAALKRAAVCRNGYVDQKRHDAMELLHLMGAATHEIGSRAWRFNKTSLWRDA